MKRILIILTMLFSATFAYSQTYKIDSQEVLNLESKSITYSLCDLYIHKINGVYYFSEDENPSSKNKYTTGEYFVTDSGKYLVFVYKNYRTQYNYISKK